MSMRIVVVGAGIGGLCVSIGLRRAGYDVVLLERAPELAEVGAGLGLFPNAMLALARLGVRDAVAAQGASARRGIVRSSAGRELTAMPPDLLDGTAAIHRADLRFAGYTAWRGRENAPDEAGGRKAEVVRRFSDWHEPVAKVIDASSEDEILRHDVYYLEPLERWSRGRVVLLGDAAHATTPGVGQGAAQAIEDAVALVRSLARHRELSTALSDYESLRRPRTEMVVKTSLRVDRVAQLSNPVACRLRNAIVRVVPERARRPGFEAIVRHEL